MLIDYLLVFLAGGLICGLGQLMLDFTNYTPAHLLVLLVVIGCILTGIGVYPSLKDVFGAGVTVTRFFIDIVVLMVLFGRIKFFSLKYFGVYFFFLFF